MNFIFLDIDGVLNNDQTKAKSPNGYVGLSDSLCKRLKHLKKEMGAVIVLTSTWKETSKEDYDYMMRKLRKFECTPLGRTYEKNKDSELRGLGIKEYIQTNDIKDYVILDDCLYDFKQHPDILKHLVQIDFHVGLTDEDCENAKKILNGEEIQLNYKEEGNYHI